MIFRDGVRKVFYVRESVQKLKTGEISGDCFQVEDKKRRVGLNFAISLNVYSSILVSLMSDNIKVDRKTDVLELLTFLVCFVCSLLFVLVFHFRILLVLYVRIWII